MKGHAFNLGWPFVCFQSLNEEFQFRKNTGRYLETAAINPETVRKTKTLR